MNDIKFATDGDHVIDVPHTITFIADEVCIGSERLAMKFEEMPLNLDDINTLVFESMDGKKTYTYKIVEK